MSTTSAHRMHRTLIVVPTYNEASSLGILVRSVRAVLDEAAVLVVDDASPDGTGAIADRLAAADSQVYVLHRPRREGLGPAYVAGFRWALDRGYDVVVEMDADGSHACSELPRLLVALQDADVVLGSRWVPGGRIENWSVLRQAISRGGNRYARRMLRLNVADPTGGFRAYRADVLRTVPLHQVASQGYCFQVEMVWRALQAGFIVAEVPITFRDRVAGHSKMTRRIVLEAAWRVTAWGVRERLSDRVPDRRLSRLGA